MSRMPTCCLLLMTALAWHAAPNAAAQERGETPAPIIHSWPLQTLPPQVAPPQPAPISLGLPGAFRLGKDLIDLGPAAPMEIMLADLNARGRNGPKPGPERVGLVRNFRDRPQPSIDRGDFAFFNLPDGRTLWTLAVNSSGSQGLRLHFTDVDLRGAECIVYGKTAPHGGVVARGPFTGKGPDGDEGPQSRRAGIGDPDGDFWTAYIPGQCAYIEVITRGGAQPSLTVTEIVHFDKHPGGSPPPPGSEDGGTNGSGVLPCHLDAMCNSETAAWAAARDATGQMNFVSGGASLVCSGTLLNDQDPDTAVPYFLTAYHCVNTQAEVNSLEVVWFWQRDSCNGALPDYNTLPRNTGGTLVASNPTSSGNDMSFIRLAGSLPGGISLAGTTTATGITGRGFHHPGGSWKRATFLSGVGVCPACLCVDSAFYDYYDMDNGLVEGGSSGSGIFNSSGQLAGQLLGRCWVGSTDNMDCSNLGDFWAEYGEFEETYPLISYYLAVGGTMHVNWAALFDGNGTPFLPFKFVTTAHNAAWSGVHIKIATGSYNEALTLNKNVMLIADGGPVIIGQ